MSRIALPIDPHLPRIVDLLREPGSSLVLQASPGSGKTTRVPPALLAAAFRAAGDEIIVLEPRRLAAKHSAARVADELGTPLGQTVGYQFRFENVSSPATRLRFLTEGMLMRRLIGDSELKQVSVVILDEFHERHLHTDVAFGYLRELRKKGRPDLRIVVMSATLDVQAVSSALGNCPIIEIEAPVHPVQIEHLPSPPAKHLDLLVRDAVARTLREGPAGDILVFLPGMAEIRRAEEALRPLESRDLRVMALHGELSREEQDAAIRRADRRKVILSTNVAETSLTIEGVTTVIDSGLHRRASYSWWSGVPALRTRPISRASAIQRAGRAGRTAPGRCLRLYTLGEFNSRPPFETPEIQRADLSQTVLELKALGVRDLESFPWFEPPRAQSVQASQALLYRLGALDANAATGSITDLGRRLARVPAHPRLGRMLVEADRNGTLEEAATLAALVHEGELDRLDALECLKGAERIPGVRRTREHLLASFRKPWPKGGSESPGRHHHPGQLEYALLTGFPDRVARKRAQEGVQKEVELVFSSGGAAKVENTGVLIEGDTFVTLDIQEQQRPGQAQAKLTVRSVCRIEADWLLDLEPSGLRETQELSWDPQRNRVQAVSRLSYDELILTEDKAEPTDPDATLRVLLRNALGIAADAVESMQAHDWISALGRVADSELVEASLARAILVKPAFQTEPLWPLIREALQGKVSLKELQETDWDFQILQAALGSEAHRAESLVPTTVQLPGGRKTRVHYKLGQAPWVESRLQDFFGMKKGPSILDGRMPLTLHLLAPNQRAVQVTTDLEGFWKRGYAELRHALSRRYPRHSWPENPLEAQPPAPRR